MRVGDCSVEVVPVGGGSVRELPSGHVLARPGQVYLLRLRNHGPLRGVAEIRVDGRRVSRGGLVLESGATVELERPIHATEHGRFTVVAEGDEAVFGPDGGRDNADLGVIEVRFRRELPRGRRDGDDLPWPLPAVRAPEPSAPGPLPAPPSTPRRWPTIPPEWSPPIWGGPTSAAMGGGWVREDRAAISAELAAPAVSVPGFAPPRPPAGDVERAAGTGLTGHSDQEFRPVRVGELEAEPTVLRLRIVIGSPEAIEAARPLPDEAEAAPARPAPRP